MTLTMIFRIFIIDLFVVIEIDVEIFCLPVYVVFRF